MEENVMNNVDEAVNAAEAVATVSKSKPSVGKVVGITAGVLGALALGGLVARAIIKKKRGSNADDPYVEVDDDECIEVDSEDVE